MRLGGLLAAMMLVSSGPVAAQASPPRHRIGPVQLVPSITLRDIGVDTNVFNGENPVKDFAMTTMPELSASVGSPRRSLSAHAQVALVYYARQASERSFNRAFDVSAQMTFRRLTPFAEARYLNTRERISNEIDARARRTEGTASGGLGIAVTPKVGLTLRGTAVRMGFNADERFDNHWLADELNRNTNSVSGEARYALTPLTSVMVSAEQMATLFTRTSLRDTNSTQIQGGMSFHPRALINGSFRIGMQRFRPTHVAVPDFDGLIGNATLSYRVGELTTIGGGFNRVVAFSYLPTEPYYLLQNLGVSVRRQVVRRWDVTLAVDRSWHRYRRSIIGAIREPDGRRERLWNSSLTTNYDLGRSARFTVGITYQQRESEQLLRTYQGVRFGTSIVYGF